MSFPPRSGSNRPGDDARSGPARPGGRSRDDGYTSRSGPSPRDRYARDDRSGNSGGPRDSGWSRGGERPGGYGPGGEHKERSAGAPRGRQGDWAGRTSGRSERDDRPSYGERSGGGSRPSSGDRDRGPRPAPQGRAGFWRDGPPQRNDPREEFDRSRSDGASAPARSNRGRNWGDRPEVAPDRVKSVRPDGSGIERGAAKRAFDNGFGSRPSGRKPRPARGVRPADQQPHLRKPVALSDAIGWERDSTPAVASRPERPEPVRQRARKLPEQVADDLHTMLGTRRGGRVAVVLNEAAKSFERERFVETIRILRPLVEEAPDSAPVRELFGIACYREGKWAEAVKHLEKFVELTGSDEQHPVLADSHRALKNYRQVSTLWDELSQSSPSGQLVAEGRIVMAGSLADQGKLLEAIALMERGSIEAKKPKDHHLRLWYCLADLYERAGDIPRARDRFQRIMAIDKSYVNVPERLANLG
jgi:hypothetical protein